MDAQDVGRPESWPSAARLRAGPRLPVPAAAWPRTARGAGVPRWVSRPWQEPRWSPSCWACCQPLHTATCPLLGPGEPVTPPPLSPARWPVETPQRLGSCGGARPVLTPGSPSVCPRMGHPVPAPHLYLRQTELCLQHLPGPGSLHRLGRRGWLLGEPGWAPLAQGLVGGAAPAVLRLGHVGVLCDPAYPVGVGGLPPTLARTCLHCPATPPCAPRAGSVISAEPPDPPLLAGASSTCSPTWPRRCTRPGCWPSSSSHRLSPPGKCHGRSGQGASPVSTRPLRADAAAAMFAGVKTRAGDPRPRSKAASGPSACHWLGPHQGRCGR